MFGCCSASKGLPPATKASAEEQLQQLHAQVPGIVTSCVLSPRHQILAQVNYQESKDPNLPALTIAVSRAAQAVAGRPSAAVYIKGLHHVFSCYTVHEYVVALVIEAHATTELVHSQQLDQLVQPMLAQMQLILHSE